MIKHTAIFNGTSLQVKDGKKNLLDLQATELSGNLDQQLEDNGFARVSAWNKVGRTFKSTVIQK